MYCENMPLYPGMRPPCDGSPCMKVRLFDDACCQSRCPPPMKVCQRVTIDNPCCPGEQAEVALGVDDCGNLVICVHRLCRAPRPRCCDWDDAFPPPSPRPCRPPLCDRLPVCGGPPNACRPPCRPRRRPEWDGCARLCR